MVSVRQTTSSSVFVVPQEPNVIRFNGCWRSGSPFAARNRESIRSKDDSQWDRTSALSFAAYGVRPRPQTTRIVAIAPRPAGVSSEAEDCGPCLSDNCSAVIEAFPSRGFSRGHSPGELNNRVRNRSFSAPASGIVSRPSAPVHASPKRARPAHQEIAG